MTLRFSPITLFPDMFEAIRNEGVIARGIERGLLRIDPVFLRDFATDARRNVDEHPIGGGDGMVIRPDIAASALHSVLTPQSAVVHLTPAGKVFSMEQAKELASHEHVIFLCGRYAGFDSRFVRKFATHHISLGDFVLSGGELASMCIIDAVSRFVPGVLGNATSAACDSFEDGLLEAPVYTKPLEYEGVPVPDILMSGDHAKIAQYRRKEQLKVTAQNRPDLIVRMWDSLSRSERSLVEKIWKHGDSLR